MIMYDGRDEFLCELILKPLVSEKSTNLSSKEKPQYVFRVNSSANKKQVAAAIEKMFSVKVTNVRVCNVIGKARSFKGAKGKCKAWKKVYVSLDKDDKINLEGIK